MPTLDRRIVDCGRELNMLFSKISLNEEMASELEALYSYFIRLMTTNPSKIDLYEDFIKGLRSLSADPACLQEMLNKLEAQAKKDKTAIVLHNVLKGIEQLFWLAAAAACISLGVIASPVLVLDPMIAIAVLTLISAVVLASVKNIVNCFNEYKSFTPINERVEREKKLLTFFANPVNKKENEGCAEPQPYPQDDEYNVYGN